MFGPCTTCGLAPAFATMPAHATIITKSAIIAPTSTREEARKTYPTKSSRKKKNCISGVLGFFATIAGSYILSHIQSNGNSLFGVQIYGQQVLSAISLVIVICAIIYDKLLVEKQDVMIQ